MQLKRHSKNRNKDLFLNTIYPSFINKKRKNIENPKKISILKFSGIGDSILLLPMLKKMKEKNFEIIVITSKENKVIFENQNFIDKLETFDMKNGTPFSFFRFFLKMKKKKFDISIDTSQSSIISAFFSRYVSKYSVGLENKKSKTRNSFFDKTIKINPEKHMIKHYQDLFKDFNLDENLKLIPPKIKQKTKSVKEILKNKNLIGIHASSPFIYRNWPKENFSKIINYLNSKGFKVLLFGSPEEKKYNKEIISKIKEKDKVFNLSGSVSFEEMFSILPKLKLFIANDGGPMHIAASFDLPVIGIFGSDSPFRYAPFNKKSYALYKPFKNGPINKPYELKWPTKNDIEIPDKIKVKEVKEVINKILG